MDYPTRPTIHAHTDKNGACDTKPSVQSLAGAIDYIVQLLGDVGPFCNLPT
jgi:hypothetical protein